MHIPRKYPRFPVCLTAHVTTADSGKEFFGSLEMVSRSGAGLSTPDRIPGGTALFLEIEADDPAGDSKWYLSGTVRNLSKWGESNLLGIEFDDEISRENDPSLDRYLTCLENEFIRNEKWNA